MRITHTDRSKVRTMIADKTCALISITTSTGLHPDIMPGWGAVYRIRFDDVDKTFNDFKLFTSEMAHDVLDFVLNIQPMTLVINCDAGLSRSTGMLIALERIINGNDVAGNFPVHNRLVCSKILGAAHERGLI